MGLALSPRAGWSVIPLYPRLRRIPSQRMRGMAGMLLSNDSRRPCNRMQRAVLSKPLFPFASTRNALSISVTPACQCSVGGYTHRDAQDMQDGSRPRHSSEGWNPEWPPRPRTSRYASRRNPHTPSFQRRLESRWPPGRARLRQPATLIPRHSSEGWNPPPGRARPATPADATLIPRHSSEGWNPECASAHTVGAGSGDITQSHRRGPSTQDWTPLSTSPSIPVATP